MKVTNLMLGFALLTFCVCQEDGTCRVECRVCFRHESEALLVDADLDIGEHVYTIETTDDVQALKFGIIMVTDSFYFRLNTYNNLQILVKNNLVGGMDLFLTFSINSMMNCRIPVFHNLLIAVHVLGRGATTFTTTEDKLTHSHTSMPTLTTNFVSSSDGKTNKTTTTEMITSISVTDTNGSKTSSVSVTNNNLFKSTTTEKIAPISVTDITVSKTNSVPSPYSTMDKTTTTAKITSTNMTYIPGSKTNTVSSPNSKMDDKRTTDKITSTNVTAISGSKTISVPSPYSKMDKVTTTGTITSISINNTSWSTTKIIAPTNNDVRGVFDSVTNVAIISSVVGIVVLLAGCIALYFILKDKTTATKNPD